MTNTPEFQRNGYHLAKGAVGDAPISEWLRAASRRMESAPEGLVSRHGEPYAMRGIVAQCPYIAACIRESILPRLIRPLLGREARLVRSLLLDKTPDNNWGVPWHRDLNIAVKNKGDVPGFNGWREKGEGWYVEPPFELLQKMVTARIHLDDCLADDGPLSVIPGSHEWPSLSWESIVERANDAEASEIHAHRGDALLMRPLLVHSSHRALKPSHRRVLHLEFCAEELPAGLEWCD
ncbi:Phytanoyl-CoA dioxygenase (PhyH) [Caulifigura coniformis]|uniref:Phytanoyl-CoA dioxygenase (PhyH) n=1 Tax=Caulifigura coniformis TaxID=2527983 RepID=A0A517SJZ3_9PLAN|nr:phytanoyl-CoA dioxygenase family protein [Caulifigura coniformis]QDT56438.1 Phytanoyl-CoA dioxygenase (PhyH) [Caulifigura coniformis]